MIVDQRVHLDYEQLCRAIQESSQGLMHTEAQGLILAEVRTCRAQIASPLDPEAERAPSSSDRSRFVGREEVTITMPTESVTGNGDAPTEIRLGPDLIAVALALSDELYMNEVDTAVLLSHARSRAAVRADRDVVAAAKELASVRRRHAVLYLQEILRAGLLSPHTAPAPDDAFVSALMRERDLLVSEHNVFHNVATRIRTGWSALDLHGQYGQQGQQATRHTALQQGELLLLSEVIFLLSYTVQLSKEEAVILRTLLTEAEQVHAALLRRERTSIRPSRAYGMPIETDEDASLLPEIVAPALVEAESVRNLFLLSWMCALDRSRYHDTYDPRSGSSDVNQLLKDPSFFPHTLNIPKLESEDAQLDPIRTLPRPIAAAELCGAIFRLAVAEPDEQECVTSFVRLSAYNETLSFLGDSLALWIEKRAGSLSPDADLYADVLEDLANDIAEAPHVLTPLLQFVMHDVQHAAATAAYAPSDNFNLGIVSSPGPVVAPQMSLLPIQGSRRARPLSMSATSTIQTPSRRLSLSGATPRGRPPLPPIGRPSGRPSSVRDGGRMFTESGGISSSGLGNFEDVNQDAMQDSTAKMPSENVLGALARFISRAIALAPSKLANPSATGNLRYWSSVGPANWGLIQRIGDAVMDLWDLAMRNPYAPGGVGQAFRQALKGYLELMASTCKKYDSPLHSMAALRFLAEGGHSVVSLEQLLRGLAHVNGQLGTVVSEQEAQIEDIDCEILGGIVNIIAQASDTLRDHGGIMIALGERGKELAMNIGALAIHNVSSSLKETLIRCLRALGDQRPIIAFLENMSKDKSAPLRHYLRGADAQSGDFLVTVRILELASLTTTWIDEEFPESAVESVATWFAIEEVLMYWSRRKYIYEAHRWHVVHSAGNLVRDVVYKDLNSSRTHRILSRLLTPAPGTGAASFSLRTLVSASGLIRTSHEYSNSNVMDPHTANWHRVSGRSSLALAVDHGLGDAYRMMQEAVRSSSRILSLLFEISPGRISVPGVSVVSAAELLNGELSSITAAMSMVVNPDSFLPQIFRAGYSPAACAAVLAMLSRAARESDNIAELFTNNIGTGNLSAEEFRSSLGHIIARCDPGIETDSNDENGSVKFTIESKDFPDPPLMHSALALVEACLGRDGSSKPGIFLLGLRLDSSKRYESVQYGVLGALVELVANPSNGDDRIDSMSRATAATFLERLAANTVRSTSLAVLEHLKDVCVGDDAVRGGGFGDEMLYRVMDVFRTFEPHNMRADINWMALGALVSACMSLSALQVRLFPDYERERCLPKRSRDGRRMVGNELTVYRGDMSQSPPSPLDLLRVLHTMTSSGGDSPVISEAFRNWYFLLGSRLFVHEINEGYCSVPLLFEVANVVLEAFSRPGSGHNLSGVVKKDGGEVAGATVLSCIDRMRTCDNVNSSLGEDFVSDAQCGALLSGIIRSLAEVSGIGSNAARGRTSFYAALLICEQIAEKRISDDVIGRGLGQRVGQRSGTEVVISAACSDAISGVSAGTKCAGLAAVSMMTRMDGLSAVASLETQGRLRRVVQTCLGDPKVQGLICEACWNVTGNRGRSHRTAQQAAVAVAEAVVGVIHAVAGSGHGMRLIAECGCVEAIALLLPRVFFRGSMAAHKRGEGTVGFREDYMMTDDGSAIVTGIDKEGDQRRSMLNGLTGALAAAISCAGSAADTGAGFAIGEGRGVLIELLRNVRLPGCVELETIGNIGLMMSRLTEEVVMGSDGGTIVCGWLASVLGAVIPAINANLQVGNSGSGLSVGVANFEPESAREARRIGIEHPEGGSLFERDLMRARSSCAQSVFAAFRGTERALYLFTAQIEDDVFTVDGGGRKNEGLINGTGAKAKGKLADVVRICKVMIREAERAAEESMQIESRLAGDSGASFATQRLNELADYCFEEHGVERECLTARVAMGCLKESSVASRRQGAVCISVFESGLLILREFICAARDIVRGRFVCRGRRLSYSSNPKGGGGGLDDPQDVTEGPMSIDEAERLLKNCEKAILPLCLEIESLTEGVWCGKSCSFSKQVCRQIRTACSTDSGSRGIGAGQRLSLGWTPTK